MLRRGGHRAVGERDIFQPVQLAGVDALLRVAPEEVGYYPVRAVYAPGQSPFVNVAEPMAPPPPPPAPLPAAPAPVRVNLGGPGPLPGGSTTPGVNAALLERQRAFAGGA